MRIVGSSICKHYLAVSLSLIHISGKDIDKQVQALNEKIKEAADKKTARKSNSLNKKLEHEKAASPATKGR